MSETRNIFNHGMLLAGIEHGFFNWVSLQGRLNSHYKAWNYKKKKEKGKGDKHIGKLSRNDPKINPGTWW